MANPPSKTGKPTAQDEVRAHWFPVSAFGRGAHKKLRRSGAKLLTHFHSQVTCRLPPSPAENLGTGTDIGGKPLTKRRAAELILC